MCFSHETTENFPSRGRIFFVCVCVGVLVIMVCIEIFSNTWDAVCLFFGWISLVGGREVTEGQAVQDVYQSGERTWYRLSCVILSSFEVMCISRTII